MRLVYKFYIRHTEELDRLFRISNNLYNQALYLFRQQLDADGTWLWCARESRCDPFANLKVTPLQVTFAKV